jgi:hypothetical protein
MDAQIHGRLYWGKLNIWMANHASKKFPNLFVLINNPWKACILIGRRWRSSDHEPTSWMKTSLWWAYADLLWEENTVNWWLMMEKPRKDRYSLKGRGGDKGNGKECDGWWEGMMARGSGCGICLVLVGRALVFFLACGEERRGGSWGVPHVELARPAGRD